MLAILTTHPIQYQVPIWRSLAKRGRVPLKVYYMSDQGVTARHDPEFGKTHAWDIDLLSGYDYEFFEVSTGQTQNSFLWLRLKDDFASKLRADGAHVLWTQGWQVAAYWQAVWQAKAEKLSIWLRAETNLRSTGQGWRCLIKKPILAGLLRRMDAFLCIGQANRQFYLSRGIKPSQLVSAPYCVENDRFAREAAVLRPKRLALREKWGVPQDAACILFVGKMIEKKRPLDLVAATRLLMDRMPDRPVHLLFVGTGQLLDSVRTQCNIAFDFETPADATGDRNHLGVTASFAGFLNQTDIAKAYVAADCLALPSEATETWGLVVNEAMACGLPAVVSDAIGCSDDLVKPNWPGFCFPLGDIEAQARSLQKCLEQPPTADDIKAVIDQFDVLRTVEAVEDLYLSTVSDQLPRAVQQLSEAG